MSETPFATGDPAADQARADADTQVAGDEQAIAADEQAKADADTAQQADEAQLASDHGVAGVGVFHEDPGFGYSTGASNNGLGGSDGPTPAQQAAASGVPPAATGEVTNPVQPASPVDPDVVDVVAQSEQTQAALNSGDTTQQ